MAEETIHSANQGQGENGSNEDHEHVRVANDKEQIKVVSAIGYLSILFLVPYLLHPKNEFAVFHANQGLLLFIVGVIINIVGRYLPFIGWTIIIPLGNLFVVILLVIGIVNAMNDKKKRLPLIGHYDILKVQK